MNNYSIKDLERISGIKAHTIRIWEKRYNLIQPERTSTNIRYYDNSDLTKILNIAILKDNGFKISKIVEMESDEMRERVVEITSSKANHSDHTNVIEGLTIAMIEFDDNRFEKILNNAILRMGFEETIINIIHPFFVRIGVLWQVGSINPAQEHFVSNLIRQKLLVAIDGYSGNVTEGAKRYLLFLPEGELHELGLLFYNFLIVKSGHRALYLGQSVPVVSIVDTVDQMPVDYIVTSLHSTNSKKSFVAQLSEILTQIPEIPVFLTNRIDFDISISNIERVHYNLSPKAFNEMLKIKV